jgi:TolB-like protein
MSATPRWSRVVAGLLPVLSACAGGTSLRLADVTPESAPALQADHAQHPQDQSIATRLGVAYFRANRLAEARATLDTVVTSDPRNGIAAIYRGMTAESQGDFAAARASYEAFLSVARSNDLKNAARQRLSLIGRRELEYNARQALAQESQLSQTAPEPNTIAVMPFAYAGTNAEIQPLTRGFAQLVVTDLAKSRQVRVLERERMQAMLDEMRLGEQNRADPQTATRSGRLLRAANVVQGSLLEQGNLLRADAAVVNVTTAEVGPNPASAALELNRLFDIEKVLVRQIFENMGIQLTDAERAAIDQRPTESLAAFLAWSRGLGAEDRGDFAAAQGFFNEAVRIDPSFGAAAQSSQQASDLQAATTQSVQQVEVAVAAAAASEGSGGGGTTDLTRDQLTAGTNGVTPSSTPVVGGEQTTNGTQPNPDPRRDDNTPKPTATIRIVIPRP